MNYTELTTNIADICQNTFTADQLAMFVKQAEQSIYNTVQIPELRKNSTATLTTDNAYLTLPTDYLYTHSLAVVDGSNNYQYLNYKDVNFIREAYPNASSTGLPKYYSQFDSDTFLLGPTPDADYTVELHYGYAPESIVTAGTTWLGDNYDSALLNRSLVEAIRFMKGEADLVTMYNNMYVESLGTLKMLGDGKLRQDTYRTKQVQVPVS